MAQESSSQSTPTVSLETSDAAKVDPNGVIGAVQPLHRSSDLHRTQSEQRRLHLTPQSGAGQHRWTEYLRTVSTFEREARANKSAQLSEASLPPAPDGGWTAWSQVLAAHLVCLNTWGFIISFGAFQTYYHATLPVDQFSISWIGSLQVFLINFVGVFSGRALDAGYFHVTYVLGVLFLLVGTFTMSLATTYWQIFLSQALCVGIGCGLLWTPAMGLVTTYFEKYRVFALALAMTGASSGGLVYPALVRELLFRPGIGFPWTVRILGFIMVGTSLVAFALFRTRLPPRSGGQFFEFSALRELPFLFLVLGMFFSFWALYFEFYYVGQFSRTVLGLSYDTSIDVLLLTNGIGVFGRLIPAYIASMYTGPITLAFPLAVITGVAYYCWTAVQDEAGIWAFAAVYGFSSNAIQGLWPGTLSVLTPDASRSGARMGMGFTVVSFGLLTGPPLGGALADSHGYLSAQIWGGTCLILASLLFLSSRIAKTGFVLRAKI